MKTIDKMFDWLRNDLSQTKKSFFKIMDYITLGMSMEEFEYQVQKEVDKVCEISRYNHNYSRTKKA